MKDDFNDNVFSQYKNVDFLTLLIRGFPTETKSSVRSCCLCVENGCPICHLQKKLRLFFAIEHLYCLVSSNIIMSFLFSLNPLTYYMSNSKTVCNNVL